MYKFRSLLFTFSILLPLNGLADCAFFGNPKPEVIQLRVEIRDLDPSFRDQPLAAPDLSPIEMKVSGLITEAESKIEDAQRILKTKEEFRRPENRDRWSFIRPLLFWTENPVNARQKKIISENKRLIETLQYIAAVKDEMLELQSLFERIDAPHERDSLIVKWIRAQVLLDIQEIANAISAGKEPPAAAKADLELMDAQMDQLAAYLSNSSKRQNEANPLVDEYIKDRRQRRTDALRELVKTELEREVNPETLLGIIGAARTSGKTFDEALKMFKEIDEIGAETFPEGVAGISEGIADREVVILTRIALQNDITANKIVGRFRTIYNRGNDSDTATRIPPMEASVLVSVSYEFNLQAGSVTKRYYAIEKLGRQMMDDFHLDDASIAYLTRVSLKTHPKRFNRAAKEAIKSDFKEMYKLGKETLDDFYINDLGIALLYGVKVDFEGNSCKDVVDEFFDVHQTFKNDDLCPTLTDENLARVTRFCFFYGISPKWVADKYSRIQEIAGEELSFTRTMTVLGFALQKVERTGNSRPEINERDLIEGLTMPYFGRKTAYDFLVGQTNIVDNRPRVTGGTSYSGGSNYSSTSRSDDSDDWGLGFSVDSDGFKPTLGIGSGMSLDLSDGSLRIGLGGGFSIDTDGDGFGFGF